MRFTERLRINDGMGKFVAENTVKKMIRAGKGGQGREGADGADVKENVGDMRLYRLLILSASWRSMGLSRLFRPAASAESFA
ncbi:hypothetical protein MASR1M12_44360 [Erysipelotrichia bacterium]